MTTTPDTRTPMQRAWGDLHCARSDAVDALEDLQAELQFLLDATTRAVRVAETATAEQRGRAERAEDALRALGAAPGHPVEWRGRAVEASVSADAHNARVQLSAGLDACPVTVFGRLEREHAVVALQPRQADLGARQTTVELFLALPPGGPLDQLYATLGGLIHERDAQRAVEASARGSGAPSVEGLAKDSAQVSSTFSAAWRGCQCPACLGFLSRAFAGSAR